MAITYSPKIVIDGLVCYYDMVNTRKSFIGAPTTNLCSFDIASAGFSTDSSGNLTQSANSTEVTYEGRLTRKMIIPAAGYCNYYIYNYNTGVSSTVFTASCKIKVSDSSNPSAFINAGYLYGTAGSFVVGVSFTALADGWYLVYWSYSGTAMTLNSLTGLTGTASATKTFYIADYQLEALAFPSTFAGVSGGTRSNTQAILDLTNNNTLTATSLTYAADNTFSFNGSGNRIDCGTGGRLTLGNNGSFTVSAWIRITTLKNFSGIISKVQSDRGGVYSFMCCAHNDGTLAFYNNAAWYYSTNAGITTNTWYNVVFSFNSSVMSYYVNGVAYGTSTLTWPETTAHKVFIGSWYSVNTIYDFHGTISNAQLHNRALSAAEVTQNFNAHRGRYGI